MRPAFFDTNVVLYLLSADEQKANIAEALLARGGSVSVQVLNETCRCADASSSWLGPKCMNSSIP